MRAIVSIFDTNTDAERAIDRLEEIGYKAKDFSVIMQDKNRAREFANDTGTDVAGSAAGGAATGAVVGGLAGLLIGIGAITIPGIGAFLIGGPLAAALGLTGAAATTTSGAATGAVAGGLIGALMGLGLSHKEAQTYEEHLKAGGILLAVPVYQNQEEPVIDILKDNHASDIKIVDNTPSSTMHHTVGRSDRSNKESLENFLQEDVDFPADKDEILDRAEEMHLDADALDALSRLSDEEYDSAEDVKHALSGDYHHARSTQSHAHHHHTVNPIQIEKYLKAVDYPCRKEDLIDTAEEEGADREVIETLQDLPEEEYTSPKDVSRAIGHLH